VKGYFQSEQILEFSAELSRLKRRRIGSANYLLREKEAGAMVYFFLKAHESQMLKKKKSPNSHLHCLLYKAKGFTFFQIL
jgi:hypothetical protein